MDSALSKVLDLPAPSATTEQPASAHDKLHHPDGSVRRQLQRNRRRIVKFFPDESGRQERAAGRKFGTPARFFFPDPDGPINVWTEDAESAAHALDCLTIRADRMLAGGHENPTDLADDVRIWLERNLNTEGHFIHSPWNTAELLAHLWQLRTALHELGWRDPHEKHWTSAMTAALRLGVAAEPLASRFAVPPLGGWLRAACDTIELRPWRKVVGRPSQAVMPTGCEARLTHARPARTKRGKLPEPGIESDSARIAVLRTDWSSDSPMLAVDFAGESFAMRFQTLGQTLVCGQWNVEILVDGQSIRPVEHWKPLCWFTDDDGLYLELQQRFDGGVLLDRQLFLARKAPVMMLVDTLKTESPGRLCLHWRMPIRQGINPAGDDSTRARTLNGSGFDCRLIPAGMPASPFTLTDASIAVDFGQLKLTSHRTGSRLIVPLVWQWDRQPLPPQFPWKPLTITNDGRVVGPDEAFAVRVPLSDGQLVFYRSLDRNLRRAFLGHQTTSESVIGRLDRKGDLKVWLMVE